MKLTITLIFLFCSTYIKAQDSDYLVMMNGDKINVKIKSLGRKEVTVKLQNGKKVLYKIEQNLVKEIYWSKKKSHRFPISIVDEETKFLPKILTGRIDMYVNSNSGNSMTDGFVKYYLSKDGETATLIPVMNFKSFVNKKNTGYFKKYLEDCPKFANTFKSELTMNLKNLCKLLEEYNSVCSKEKL